MFSYILARRIIFALAILGIIVMSYLTMKDVTGGPIACSWNHGCEIVRQSKYSHIKGIPIAVFGLGMYLTLSGLAIYNKPRLMSLIVLISGIGVAVSLFLTYLQFHVIHALCQWCETSALLIALIFICILFTKRPTKEIT